jgi:hypothetical protein
VKQIKDFQKNERWIKEEIALLAIHKCKNLPRFLCCYVYSNEAWVNFLLFEKSYEIDILLINFIVKFIHKNYRSFKNIVKKVKLQV